jgi:hypothetical protein
MGAEKTILAYQRDSFATECTATVLSCVEAVAAEAKKGKKSEPQEKR